MPLFCVVPNQQTRISDRCLDHLVALPEAGHRRIGFGGRVLSPAGRLPDGEIRILGQKQNVRGGWRCLQAAPESTNIDVEDLFHVGLGGTGHISKIGLICVGDVEPTKDVDAVVSGGRVVCRPNRRFERFRFGGVESIDRRCRRAIGGCGIRPCGKRDAFVACEAQADHAAPTAE